MSGAGNRGQSTRRSGGASPGKSGDSGASDEFPVLTEEASAPRSAPVSLPSAEELAADIERAVLERLAPQIERAVRVAVREAVAHIVAQRERIDHDS